MDDFTWKFYINSKDAWDSMLSACRDAKEFIYIEHYIFDSDKIGTEFLKVLREKNKEGVKVKLLLDMIGSIDFYNSGVPEELRSEGIEVKFFNIVSPWKIFKFTNWFFRDHKKILVVDNKIGFTGGLGIRDNMTDWRDTTVKVEGSVVKEMTDTVNEMWKRADDHGFVYRVRGFRHQIRRINFITNDPYFKKRFLYYSFIESLRGAKKNIYITNPYLIPDRRLTRVLKLAVRRGVDVRILIPLKMDVPVLETAVNSILEGLLRKGVKIYRFQPVFLHAKTVTVDGEWGTFGSFNLDNLGLRYNHEANIVTFNSNCVEDLNQMFFKDLEKSGEVNLREWRKRSNTDKVREFFVSFIRGFL